MFGSVFAAASEFGVQDAVPEGFAGTLHGSGFRRWIAVYMALGV